MRSWWQRRRGGSQDAAAKMITAAGDPEGVARARRELARSQHALDRDRKEVIEPLRREVYKNNIQDLVDRLLHGERGKRDPGTSAH